MGPDVREWVSEPPCWDLTDATLADEDTNSILTDNANGAIQGNVAMQWRNLVANFRTNASGATSCPNFEPMQVVPICNSMQVAKLQVQIAPSGDQNVQTLDEASYGGKIFYLHM